MADFKARDYILKDKQIIEQMPEFTGVETAVSKGKLYKGTDNAGDTYYYRGAVEDNYFKFADFYWRIIRINSNGSLRLIYDGTQPHKNGESSTDRQIGEMAFNSSYDNNAYIGLVYKTGTLRGHDYNSTILGGKYNPTTLAEETAPASGTLNWWYEQNILGTNYEERIEKDVIFCSDRRSTTSSSMKWSDLKAQEKDTGGTGTTTTYYGARSRIYVDSANEVADLSCHEEDQLSASDNVGKHYLKYPIGLITADEVLLAGGFYNTSNYAYYLYTGDKFWTMSPCSYNSNARVFGVYSTGDLYYGYVGLTTGVRPVINIKGSVTLTGDGSIDSPYEITEPVIHHSLAKNGKVIEGIAKNGKMMLGIAHAGEIIWEYEEPKPKYPTPEEAPFATATDEQIGQVLEAYYNGLIDINDYWKVGDTRVMHLNAMASGTGASESHVAQDMTMVIIGTEHDDLATSINDKAKAAITVQCKEILGNKGSAEYGYIWGVSTSTTSDSNYSKNPRRTWLNETFVNALPSDIQPLVKTVIKKNINDHSSSPSAGPDTEDKAFLTSYTEMFGNVAYSYYMNSKKPNNEEGERYAYYNSNSRRIKYPNNNGTAGSSAYYYWLRSPSSYDAKFWIRVNSDGSANYNYSSSNSGLAPAFCL